ncbi:hypothetical protein ASPZODRAFT_128059 [Penicilliopsis zonata CBS 506.65]|uniref:EamA domain-containing protein n=1 Tax=Penicilliopsis zonata CBS 506.65 TaxID=1073090 RepID=A0A1L9SQT2_9EURO|nr:hypothetical protein ASPZODRAFT_128059 [Penicilliopsis zonata CBS 506.65]OJJ49570.1 hypothetical protein ASPZODRAFT_128059 [Penicilliopsis zonata CBS 506.65]
MNVMTQLLEVDGPHGKPMHPFQVLFVRMSITVVVSVVYMWHQKIPNPLGTRETILLLLIRAGGGFFGVFSFYYSVRYMPLSEATVLTFLSPILVCYACSVLLPQEIFTRKQLLAGLVSLLGVVLIARPFSRQEPDDDGIGTPYSTNTYHHLLAVLVSMVGVLGSASALAAIRIIAQRAHPLVSVTYFSVCTTAVSTIALAAIPSIPFRLPGNVTEWALLLGLGICGFVMQFLLTAGLAYAPPSPGEGLPSGGAGGGGGGGGSRRSSAGSRATFMVYTQMLVALFYDKVIWNMTLTALSWAGSGLILGSAVYVAVAHEERYVQTQSPVSCEEEGIEIQQMSAENCKGDVTGQETGVEDVDLRH